MLHLALKDYKAPTICNPLKSIVYWRKRIFVFEEVHGNHSIARKPGSGRLSKVTAEIKALFEQLMQTVMLRSAIIDPVTFTANRTGVIVANSCNDSPKF